MQYDIYQIQIPREVTDYVNSNDRGHLGGEEKYPIYEAHMRNTMGNRGDFKPEDFAFYTKVCSVKEDGGLVKGPHDNSADAPDNSYLVQDKEEVFKILNGYYFDEDQEVDIVFDNHVFGYGMKTFTNKDGEVIEYRDMHSLSVGDIVAEVTDEGTFYFQVADWGYTEVFPKASDIAVNRIKEAV